MNHYLSTLIALVLFIPLPATGEDQILFSPVKEIEQHYGVSVSTSVSFDDILITADSQAKLLLRNLRRQI